MTIWKGSVPQDHRQRRILIVEDDEKIRDILSRLLQVEGHDVRQACNGEEAVAITAQEEKEFDAIFLDVKMPKMDGVEAFRKMSARAPLKNVVFMTAFPASQELETLVKEETVEYLHKPCTLQTIRKTLRELGARQEGPVPLPELKKDKH